MDPNYGGQRVFPDGLVYRESALEQYAIREDDPLSAQARCTWSIGLERDDWHVRIETESIITSTHSHYELRNTVTTYLADEVFFDRIFETRIERTST